MANFNTKDMDIVVADGFKLLGAPRRQDILVDLFNESNDVLRLYMGIDILATDTPASIPVPPNSNYTIDCKRNQSKIYVKTEGTAKVSFVEG